MLNCAMLAASRSLDSKNDAGVLCERIIDSLWHKRMMNAPCFMPLSCRCTGTLQRPTCNIVEGMLRSKVHQQSACITTCCDQQVLVQVQV